MTAPARQHTVVGGRSASYQEAGSGPVAILTAGLGMTGRFYEHSFGAFAAAGVRLIVPDLPGWGDTPGPRTGLTPEATASFLIEFADALGVRRPVWIGHSLGAQPVVEIAAARPDRAAGLILVGPTGAPGRWRLLRQLKGLVIEGGRTTLAVLGATAREYSRTSPSRYIGSWIRHGRHDMAARLPQVRCPALLLVGDADAVVSRAAIEVLRHRIPRAQVVRVRGATHALPRGHAEVFNRLAIEFVRSTAAAG